MSAMLGRTWNFISAAVNPDGSSGIKWTPPKELSEPGGDLPKGLASFLKSILTEPDTTRILEENRALVKSKLEEPGVKDASVADGLLRMMVADLHGLDVSFARVHALKLAQKGGNLSLKKIGYLTSVCLLKEPSDPLNLLLVNTILKDLGSKNTMEVHFALCASSSHLIPDEVVPLLLPPLLSKTTHIKDFIRKKALASLHSLLRRRPELASDLEGPTRRCLMDQSLGVLSVALQVTRELLGKVDLSDITSGILDIADQIMEDKLSAEYKYKGLSAPWILFDVVSLLTGLLQRESGEAASENAERFAQLLKRIMGKSSKELIAHAITFECIRGVHAIQNKGLRSDLLAKALPAVSKFLQDKSANLKYIGIASMELLFKDSDLILTSEQEQVVSNCLNYPDETIRRKTLSLLHVLAHENNVRQICNTLLNYIKETEDKYKRKEFLEKASDLSHKFKESQGMDWYINVLLRLSQVSPSDMRHDFLHRIKSVLSSKSSNAEEQYKVGIKLKGVLSRFLFGEDVKVSKSMTSLYIWCWSHFEPDLQALPTIHDAAKKADTEESIVDALFFIFTQNPSSQLPEVVHSMVSLLTKHQNERIADKARELESLMKLLENEELPSPLTGHDFTLSYLDEYIMEETKVRELMPYRIKSSLLGETMISPQLESERSRLRLTPYNELPSPGSKTSDHLSREIQSLESSPMWTLGRSNKSDGHTISKKHSDSLESFFVEEKHTNFGLESLSQNDFAMTEEEDENL